MSDFSFTASTADLLVLLFRIAVIVGGAFLVSRLARRGIDGVVERLEAALLTEDEAETEERRKRLTTLGGIAGKSAAVLIWAGAVIMVLRESGFDVVPLLAGVGVAGLAIGFGAQNLIRDVISGAFMLLENQIRVGDVATLNGTGGSVQEINLRTTVLRDFEGVVHVFPNGTITTISNHTQAFSNYVFNVGVAYKEDPDHVMDVLRGLSAEFALDPQWQDKVLEPLEVFGLDKFADSAVIIKMRIKTDAGKQWAVGRELNRRIKKRFDAEGIEIPFPHRTVFLEKTATPLHLDDEAQSQIKKMIRDELAEGDGRSPSER